MQVSQARSAKQDVPECTSPRLQCPGSPSSRGGHGPGGNAHSGGIYILSIRGDGEAVSKNWLSGRMGDVYVTSEARAGCE